MFHHPELYALARRTRGSTTSKSVSGDWKVNPSLFYFDLILVPMQKAFAEPVWTAGGRVLAPFSTTHPQYTEHRISLPRAGGTMKSLNTFPASEPPKNSRWAWVLLNWKANL